MELLTTTTASVLAPNWPALGDLSAFAPLPASLPHFSACSAFSTATAATAGAGAPKDHLAAFEGMPELDHYLLDTALPAAGAPAHLPAVGGSHPAHQQQPAPSSQLQGHLPQQPMVPAAAQSPGSTLSAYSFEQALDHSFSSGSSHALAPPPPQQQPPFPQQVPQSPAEGAKPALSADSVSSPAAKSPAAAAPSATKKRRGRKAAPVDPLRVEEEREARLEKNRQSARDCRRRRKAYVQQLEHSMAEFAAIKSELELLRKENISLRAALAKANNSGGQSAHSDKTQSEQSDNSLVSAAAPAPTAPGKKAPAAAGAAASSKRRRKNTPAAVPNKPSSAV